MFKLFGKLIDAKIVEAKIKVDETKMKVDRVKETTLSFREGTKTITRAIGKIIFRR